MKNNNIKAMAKANEPYNNLEDKFNKDLNYLLPINCTAFPES